MTRPQSMLGLFKTAKGPGNMVLLEAPVPVPGPNEALLEIKATGICGTDMHIKHDRFPYWPPVIMGHEFSGVVVEVGSLVANFRVGDRVVGEPHTRACGKCDLCRTGNIQISLTSGPQVGALMAPLPGTWRCRSISCIGFLTR